jgi:hypothetical protein
LDRLRKRGPPLGELVRHQREDLVLGEHDLLIVQRAVEKAQHHPALHPAVARELGDIALPEALPVEGVHGEEAAGHALDEPHRHRLRARRAACPKGQGDRGG